MRLERVEAVGPECAIRGEPLVELAQRARFEAVEAALRLAADGHQARLAKDPQMLRHRRLAEPEIRDELADRALARSEQVEDPAPVRLGERVEAHARQYAKTVI